MNIKAVVVGGMPTGKFLVITPNIATSADSTTAESTPTFGRSDQRSRVLTVGFAIRSVLMCQSVILVVVATARKQLIATGAIVPRITGEALEALNSRSAGKREPIRWHREKGSSALRLRQFPIRGAFDQADLDLPIACGITEDGSLSEGGIEILTPPARGGALAEYTMKSMTALLDAGYDADESCGLHTHIDLRDKVGDSRFLSRLFTLAFAVEDVLYGLQMSDRWRGSYSYPLRTGYGFNSARGVHATDIEFVYNKLDKKDRYARRKVRDLRETKWGNRYYSWNFHSVFYRGTMEVRMHEGTLDAERVLNWADLIQSIVKRAESRVYSPTLLKFMRIEDRDKKLSEFGKLLDLTPRLNTYVNQMSRPYLPIIPWEMTDAYPFDR